MIHPDTELRHVNDEIGLGVFATRTIPRGTIIWARDNLDQTFTPAQVARMAPEYQAILEKYSFVDAQGQYVLCWDHSRFFNHSCEANCLSGGYDFELAIRDIQAGEELTDDYGTLNLRARFRCACGAPGCRQWVLPDDMERLAHVWDGKVHEVFPLIRQVAQPLWNLVREKESIIAALREPRLLRSDRMNYAPLDPAARPPGTVPEPMVADAVRSTPPVRRNGESHAPPRGARMEHVGEPA